MKQFIFFISLGLFLTGCSSSDGSSGNKEEVKHALHNKSSVTIIIKKSGQNEAALTLNSGACSLISTSESKLFIHTPTSSSWTFDSRVCSTDVPDSFTLLPIHSPPDPNNPCNNPETTPAEAEIDLSKGNYHTITKSDSSSSFSVSASEVSPLECSAD